MNSAGAENCFYREESEMTKLYERLERCYKSIEDRDWETLRRESR